MKSSKDNLPAIPPTGIIPRQADTDEQLVQLWLHGKSPHTQRRYRRAYDRLCDFLPKPLHSTTLGDLQSFAESLATTDLCRSSQNRILSAIKSLIAFGHRIGYLPFDVGRVLKLPGHEDTLSQRILEEGEVQRMIALEPNPRNRIMLLLLYASGVRVSELCSLKWSRLTAREDAGQITVHGKKEKTRVILLPVSVWEQLCSLRGDANDDAPVFRSRKGGHLDPSQIWRIVRKASERAGVDKDVSCHWLRHSHATHALDRGAPIHLVQATLGHSSISTTGKYLHARPNDSSSKYLPL